MNSVNPVGVIVFSIVAIWLARMWILDARERPEGGGLPGATRCPWRAIFIAIAGTLVLLAMETWGEIQLGISAEQKKVTWLALSMFAAAAFTEEVIFRGYLVVERRGRGALWASAIAFSLIFALLHDYLWQFEWSDERAASSGIFSAVIDGFSLNFSVKGLFSTSFIFIGSLWFYFVRFFKWNPHASLAAPVVAHMVKNLAVFAIKLAQGYVG